MDSQDSRTGARGWFVLSFCFCRSLLFYISLVGFLLIPALVFLGGFGPVVASQGAIAAAVLGAVTASAALPKIIAGLRFGSVGEVSGSLATLVENAFKGGGVHLVVVPIDYSENTRVLVDELREKLKQVAEPAAE